MKRNLFFILIGLFICSFASTYLFKGCGHQNEQSLKSLLLKNEKDFSRIREIKERLFKQDDSTESFIIEYTGRSFFQFKHPIDASNPNYSTSSKYLNEEDEIFFRSFMNEEDIYYLFLYRNRETYSFLGYDCMDITDGTYKDDGVEIEKNVYFRPWSVEKNKQQASDQ